MKTINVSFDFDGTLSNNKLLQDFAKSLILEDYIKVWIVTTRYEVKCSQGLNVDNTDLYELANKIGIEIFILQTWSGNTNTLKNKIH